MEEVTLGKSQLSYALYPHKGTSILNEKHDILRIDLWERRSVYKRQMIKRYQFKGIYTHILSSSSYSKVKHKEQSTDGR